MGGGGPFIEAEESGLGASDAPVFLKFAIDGWKEGVLGADGRPGMTGAVPTGGLGADIDGGFGADLNEDSGSDRYEASRFAGSSQHVRADMTESPLTTSVHARSGFP